MLAPKNKIYYSARLFVYLVGILLFGVNAAQAQLPDNSVLPTTEVSTDQTATDIIEPSSETGTNSADESVSENSANQEMSSENLDNATTPGGQESTGEAETQTIPAPAKTSSPGNVSLDFRDVEIKNILKILSLKSGVNIVAGPEVTGLVSIQLTDVPWEHALGVILQTYGYASERDGNIIIVTTIENLKKRREDTAALAEQEPLVTKTFTLNFSRASEVIESLQKMKSERGNIDFDNRTNTLIVRDTQKQIDLMSNIIKTLDATTPQVLIEAKVIETTLSNTEKLGVDWTLQATLSAGKRPTAFPFEPTATNTFLQGQFPAPTEDLFTYGTVDFSRLQAIMEVLKSRSDTKILSNPKIVTLDNKPARVVVGSQYPIPTYTYNEQQARLQVSGWEYKDIGIIFDVTPHVNRAKFVTIDIEPKITAILDFVTVESTSLPRLSNESTKTSVMVKDSQTLVIAGLIKDQTTQTKKKIPLLGDIPGLGTAFSKNEDTVSKTDLLLFITPHIITPDVPADY